MHSASDAVGKFVHHLSTAQKLVDGDTVLITYYIIIILFFLFDYFLQKHMKRLNENDSEIDERILKFYKLYQKHGFIFVNIVLFLIVMVLVFIEEGVEFEDFLTVIVSFIFFTILMKLLLKLFIDENDYQSKLYSRAIHVVSYLILGTYFCFFMPFVRPPNLILAFLGLIVGIMFCLYIMVFAIFNPEILRRGSTENFVYSEAFGILKGMLGVVVCILALEYMMIYSANILHKGLYQAGNGRVLTGYDLFYYLIISFTTIGYGDIYPVPIDGLYYSEFTAIVIGLTSMFTTGCFISAVISTANNIAENSDSLQKKKEKKEKKKLKEEKEKKEKTQ